MTSNPIIPHYTHHARQRMDEMRVTPGMVIRALSDPDLDYKGIPKHGDHRVACKGEIAVAYKLSERDGKPVVLTILYNHKEFVRPEHQKGKKP